MRYDTPIYFQEITPGEYDPDTGNYAPDSVKETLKYAAVMDTGTDMLNLVYGSIKQGSLTIQLQTHFTEPFDYIRVGKKRYKVDFPRLLRVKHTLVVSEVQ